MRALVWHGTADNRCDSVPIRKLRMDATPSLKSRLAQSAAQICIFMINFMPGMKSGDIMGHETMGEVVEIGKDNKRLKIGDRIVVPFTIICGECEQCRRGNFSVCERTNRNKKLADKAFGHSTAGAVRLHPSNRRMSRRPS